MLYLIMGLAVAFNLIVIKVKLEKGRISDGLMDTGALILVASVFSGSEATLMIGTVASALISIFLFFSPPKFQFFSKQNKSKEIKKELLFKIHSVDGSFGLTDVKKNIQKGLFPKTRPIKGW